MKQQRDFVLDARFLFQSYVLSQYNKNMNTSFLLCVALPPSKIFFSSSSSSRFKKREKNMILCAIYREAKVNRTTHLSSFYYRDMSKIETFKTVTSSSPGLVRVGEYFP